MLKMVNVRRDFGAKRAVHDVSLQIERGSFVGVIGRSGAGKSTLLRMINRLQDVSCGEILWEGRDVTRLKGQALRDWRASCAMVFQQFNIVGRLDVMTNVLMGRLNHTSRVRSLLKLWSADDRAIAVSALEQLDMTQYAGQRAETLSGGQQQRVALARSLAPKPDLLLLDEPLSSLDADLRPRLRDELRALLKAEGTAALLVTHDQDEAFAFADAVGVMLDGRLAQWAPGYTLYHEPASEAVARFVGEGRLLPVRARADGRIDSPFGTLEAAAGLPAGGAGLLLVRPDDLVLGEGDTEATLLDVVFHGAESMHRLRLDDGQEVAVLAPSHRRFHPGERLRLRADFAHRVVFPR